MINEKLNIIHLPHRTDRYELLMKELTHQNINDYKIWDGLIDKQLTKRGISKAHKQIIQDAKEKKLPMVIVAEDDISFTGTFAWNYFIENKPKDFDIYVASYYSGSHDENFVVTGLRGLTLYICHSRYYETFLSLPEHLHIDAAIAASGAKIVVCPEFVAIQIPSYSDQRKRYADDSNRLKNKIIFEG